MIKIVRFFFQISLPKSQSNWTKKNLLCASVRTKKKSSQNNAEAALEMKSFSFEVLDSLKGLLRSHQTQSLKFFQIIETFQQKFLLEVTIEWNIFVFHELFAHLSSYISNQDKNASSYTGWPNKFAK